MTIREVIEKLQKVNPEAQFEVIAHNCAEPFTFVFSGADGGSAKDCISYGPYLDRLNDKEN